MDIIALQKEYVECVNNLRSLEYSLTRNGDLMTESELDDANNDYDELQEECSELAYEIVMFGGEVPEVPEVRDVVIDW